MKAAVVGETALEIRDVPQPKPKPNEVLIKVRAIGLNRAELPGAYGSGHTRVTGTIPGIECAGEVVAIGAEVQGVKVGDRVMGSGQGSVAPRAIVAELPSLVSELLAGRIPVDVVKLPLSQVEQAWNTPVPPGQRVVLLP